MKFDKSKMAKLLNISRQTLYSWIKEGMPVEKNGDCDVKRCIEWATLRAAGTVEPIASNPDNAAGSSGESLTDTRKRDLAAAAALKEQELQRRRGELLERSQVKEEWAKLLLTFRKAMLQMPGRIAPRLAGKDQAAIFNLLEKEVRQILTALGNYNPEEGE